MDPVFRLLGVCSPEDRKRGHGAPYPYILANSNKSNVPLVSQVMELNGANVGQDPPLL